MGKTYIIIPARYASTRFPGKPLVEIQRKPMIQWVYEAASKVEEIEAVYVATDCAEIEVVVKKFGGNCIITSDKHQSGTERIVECINLLHLADEDIVLNIQGDEPLIKPEMINELKETMKNGSVMGTLKEEITDSAEIDNPNIVKVITDINNEAIYFSRYPIPYKRNNNEKLKYYRHIGIYGYTVGFLRSFTKMQKSFLEDVEGLEQLRVLENGYKIRVMETNYHSLGVDTPEQVQIVEQMILKKDWKK